jgi:hypothetical protein
MTKLLLLQARKRPMRVIASHVLYPFRGKHVEVAQRTMHLQTIHIRTYGLPHRGKGNSFPRAGPCPLGGHRSGAVHLKNAQSSQSGVVM